MNHTEAVTARKVREYNTLIRLVQESQRCYADVLRAQDSGTPQDERVASGYYHDADQLLRRRAAVAFGLTEYELNEHNADR